MNITYITVLDSLYNCCIGYFEMDIKNVLVIYGGPPNSYKPLHSYTQPHVLVHFRFHATVFVSIIR